MADGEKARCDIKSMLAYILSHCPEDPYLRMRARQVTDLQERLHRDERELLDLIAEFQAKCPHKAMEDVRKFDFDYRARISGVVRGFNVLLGHKCPVCKIFKPRREGSPWEVCHNCGGDMKLDRVVQHGMDEVRVHQCTVCGHEYEMT